MKRTTIYQIIIFVLIAINLGTLAFIWLRSSGSEERIRPPSTPGFLVRELNLSGPQRKEYFILRNDHHERLKQLEKRDRMLHQQFFDLLLLDIPDNVRMNALADSIAANRKKMEVLTYEHFFNIIKILNPEQQKKFGIIFPEILRRVLPAPPPPPLPPPPPPPPPPGSDDPSPPGK